MSLLLLVASLCPGSGGLCLEFRGPIPCVGPVADRPSAVAQQPRPEAAPTLLTAAEAGTLREKFRRCLKEEDALRSATDLDARELDRAERALARADEEFRLDWQKMARKGDLLASVRDLRQLFTNCFPLRGNPPAQGVWRTDSVEFPRLGERYAFTWFVPKGARADTPLPIVMMLPGPADAASIARHRQDAFGELGADYCWHGVPTPANWRIDEAPDRSKDGGDEVDAMRVRWVFGTFGEAIGRAAIDRNRVFLDCGRDASAFGLRFATLFPDRFAGVVLRDLRRVDDLRLGSLASLPVLLVRSPATAAAVDALVPKLEQAAPGLCKVLDATDEYPHPGLAGAIVAWMDAQRRSMAPRTVRIEPNTDDHNRAYWVDIEKADSLDGSPPDRRVRIEAVADRANNVVRVQCVGVERLRLYLNDELVDLGKPFLVVVNGREFREQRTRSFETLRENLVRRRDWEVLFPVTFTTSVPK